MITKHKELRFTTAREGDWRDLTSELNNLLSEWAADLGLISVQAIGSTGSVVSIECEEGLLRHDLQQVLAKLVPPFAPGKSHHEAKWQDGNAHSHLRATLLGAQGTFAVVNGALHIGKWQHIVFLELDTRGRDRRISIVFVGNATDIQRNNETK